MLIRTSLEEQADLTAGGKEKSIRPEIPVPPPHTEAGRGHCPSTGRHSFTSSGVNAAPRTASAHGSVGNADSQLKGAVNLPSVP